MKIITQYNLMIQQSQTKCTSHEMILLTIDLIQKVTQHLADKGNNALNYAEICFPSGSSESRCVVHGKENMTIYSDVVLPMAVTTVHSDQQKRQLYLKDVCGNCQLKAAFVVQLRRCQKIDVHLVNQTHNAFSKLFHTQIIYIFVNHSIVFPQQCLVRTVISF